MMVPPLFFAGFPGGIELLVIFLVFVLLFGVPMTLLVAFGYKYVRDAAGEPDEARLEELESDVAELRARLEEVDE